MLQESRTIDLTVPSALSGPAEIPLGEVTPGTRLLEGLSSLTVAGAPGPLTAHLTFTPPDAHGPLVGAAVLLNSGLPALAVTLGAPGVLALSIAEGLPAGAHITGTLLTMTPAL